MLTRIYRIESPFGRGMYQSDIRMGKNIGKWDCGAMTPIDLIGRQFMGIEKLSSESRRDDKEDARPGPDEDGIKLKSRYEENRKWYYGFKDLKQLTRWFEDKVSVKDIIDMGLVIRVLDVTRVQHGRCQVVYHSKSVKNSFVICNGELYKMYHQEEARYKAEMSEKQKIAAEARKKHLHEIKMSDSYSNFFGAIKAAAPKPFVLEDSDTLWGTPISAELSNVVRGYEAGAKAMRYLPVIDNPPPPEDDPIFIVNSVATEPYLTYTRPNPCIERVPVQNIQLKYFGIGAKGVSSESIENRNNGW